MARKVDTDFALHHKRVQLNNIRKQHTALLERRRAVKAMQAATTWRDLHIQHGTLLEASRRLPISLQRHYHDSLAELSERMQGASSGYVPKS